MNLAADGRVGVGPVAVLGRLRQQVESRHRRLGQVELPRPLLAIELLQSRSAAALEVANHLRPGKLPFADHDRIRVPGRPRPA